MESGNQFSAVAINAEKSKAKKKMIKVFTKISFDQHFSLLRTFFFDPYLQLIAPINLWNKCIDLRLFSKFKEGTFLRTLRSKNDSVIIYESLAAILEKVICTDLCMTNSFKVLIYLTLISFFLHYLQE